MIIERVPMNKYNGCIRLLDELAVIPVVSAVGGELGHEDFADYCASW